MTVGRLLQEISNDELLRWYVYYGRKAQREELEMKKGRGGA